MLSADQRTRNAVTRCVLRAYNSAKCDCGRGSAQEPAREAYSAPPDLLAGFKGAVARRGGGEEGTEGEGRGGEVDSDAQLEQGRRLAKAGLAGHWATSFPLMMWVYIHSNFRGGLRKLVYLETARVMAVQVHPKSLILVPIESVYMCDLL